MTILITLVGAAILAGIGGFAYTFHPGFCTTCHIMEPYFESWEQSVHGELGISCIKCHYSPGFKNTVRGKLKGVSELVVFLTTTHLHHFSSSIEDASCLRSGCHETRLLEGETGFANARFDHAPHLTEERRGKQVRCTSCHSQIVQGAHISVTATTCYLCHFKNQTLGEGISDCLICHSVPDTSITLADGTEFDHLDSEVEEIGCVHCHSKDIRGKGEVPKERCTVCHQDPSHLARYADTDLIHENHVTDFKIECLDCHLSIEHGSLDMRKPGECSACHENPHLATDLLMAGEDPASGEQYPSRKQSIHLGCGSCHRLPEVGADGSVVLRATPKACDDCHGEGTGEMIEEWEEMIAEALAEFEPRFLRVENDLDAYRNKTSNAYLRARESFENAARSYAWVRKGHGVHNPDFASMLLDSATDELDRAIAFLEDS
jgi:hypothetical protein